MIAPGAFAESLNDNDFISQIGNDDNDDDEEISTPFIIDKRKSLQILKNFNNHYNKK